jgi:D-threo-aldose 1-dehydrogenase
VKRHRIGRTDVYVSELGFGGAPIGNLYEPVADEDAAAALRTA